MQICPRRATTFSSTMRQVLSTMNNSSLMPLLSGEDQAARLVQLHVQSQSVGIAHAFWYSLRGYAGFINSDFSPLPSYAAHVELTRRLTGMRFLQTVSLGGESRLLVREWSAPDGRRMDEHGRAVAAYAGASCPMAANRHDGQLPRSVAVRDREVDHDAGLHGRQ
jgi:hypothetical protein